MGVHCLVWDKCSTPDVTERPMPTVGVAIKPPQKLICNRWASKNLQDVLAYAAKGMNRRTKWPTLVMGLAAGRVEREDYLRGAGYAGNLTFATSSSGESCCGATPTPCSKDSAPPSQPEMEIRITPSSDNRYGISRA